MSNVDNNERVAILETLVGKNGDNGIRGELREVKEDVKDLRDEIAERFDKLTERIWWLVGGLFAGACVIAGAILAAH